MSDDTFELWDLKVEVTGEQENMVCSHRVGDYFEVIGESYVAIYDGTRWSAERDTIYQLPEGSQNFYFLKNGDRYDLRKRKVIQK